MVQMDPWPNPQIKRSNSSGADESNNATQFRGAFGLNIIYTKY